MDYLTLCVVIQGSALECQAIYCPTVARFRRVLDNLSNGDGKGGD